MLFIESAEGGAGVLRRLVDEPGALPKAARTALEIMHFDPDTGADLGADEPGAGRERCVRACYDCLLSYGNQRVHELIDRHLVRDLLLRLAVADGRPTAAAAAATEPSAQAAESAGRPSSSPGSRSRGLRLPDDARTAIAEGTPAGLHLPPARRERWPSSSTARRRRRRPALAGMTRRARGASAISAGASSSSGPGADWATIAARYPSVFGVAVTKVTQ